MMKRTLLILPVTAVLSLGTLTPWQEANAATITFNLWQGMKYGFVTPSIRSAQEALRTQGYLNVSSPTGFFGEKTRAAVESYQRAHGLVPTGAIGSLTRAAMNEEIAGKKVLRKDVRFKELGEFAPQAITETKKELEVPLIEQKYPLSCEAASLEMALRYKGVEKNQDEIIEEIGVAKPELRYKGKDGSFVWGDPNEGFVGDIRGWLYSRAKGMIAATGWGVNKGPVARVAASYRPESRASSGTLEEIIKEISGGNPVIVWQYSPLPKNLLTFNVYRTPEGKAISFVPTHVNLVVGFRKNPGGKYTFLINDPEYGRIEMNEDEFDILWSKYNRDMVVVR